ncbi:MAG: response regulator transcription factor [Gallicola sp.]|nr:response regulator transcription factor [Gallicola sp.]
MNGWVVVAEDDRDIRKLIKLYLKGEGFEVLEAANGVEALEKIHENPVDILLVDLMMPEMDGYELISELREFSDMPIIIISSKSDDNDKILGLNIGADDYLSKPFNVLEVVARVKSQMRRVEGFRTNILNVNGLILDLDRYVLQKGEEWISLTPSEFRILNVLMRSPGRVFTKAQLYESINGDYLKSDANAIMVHISKLREKIEEDPRNPSRIKTVRGLGYRFEK